MNSNKRINQLKVRVRYASNYQSLPGLSYDLYDHMTQSTLQIEDHLVKSGFVVEMFGNSRKLRFMFLFTDVLVCTKHKQSGRCV